MKVRRKAAGASGRKASTAESSFIQWHGVGSEYRCCLPWSDYSQSHKSPPEPGCKGKYGLNIPSVKQIIVDKSPKVSKLLSMRGKSRAQTLDAGVKKATPMRDFGLEALSKATISLETSRSQVAASGAAADSRQDFTRGPK